MIIKAIRRISDGWMCGSTENLPFEQELQLNVLPNYGGTAEDYELINYEIPEPPESPEPEPVTTEDRLTAVEAAMLDLMGV